jgi:16S rRNA (cytosine1402-N4)-methyltransferase
MCQSGDISSSSSPPTELALTAAHVVNEWDPDTIAAVLQRFGDETNHRAIAKQIVLRRPLTSTLQLEAAISGVTPWRRRAATLARCFQALRIVVNDEMSALDEALAQAAGYVCEGGRLVVLSYHSLEDRKVKRLLRGLRTEGSPVPAQQPPRHNATGKGQGREQRPTLPWEPLLKKAQVASAAEVALNGRARSAKLRAAVRTALPHQQV